MQQPVERSANTALMSDAINERETEFSLASLLALSRCRVVRQNFAAAPLHSGRLPRLCEEHSRCGFKSQARHDCRQKAQAHDLGHSRTGAVSRTGTCRINSADAKQQQADYPIWCLTG